MTETLPRAHAHAALPRYAVRREHDPRVLDALLAEDPAYSAYALGHLEPGLIERAVFWVGEACDPGAAAGGVPTAGVVMHGAATLGRTTVVAGDPGAVDAILSLHPGPRRTYISTAAAVHLPVLRRRYRMAPPQPMLRMEVTAGSFVHPVGGGGAPTIRRLRGWDAGALNRLYAAGHGPTGYRPDDVEAAVYWGAYAGRRLVAAAGTHVIAPHHGVAMVGNVFTVPEYRGRGLGRRVTGAVTAELLERGIATVALTVDPRNTPAIVAYRALGYRAGARVFEGRARRADRLAVGAWWRRLRARRLAAEPRPGTEITPGDAR